MILLYLTSSKPAWRTGDVLPPALATAALALVDLQLRRHPAASSGEYKIIILKASVAETECAESAVVKWHNLSFGTWSGATKATNLNRCKQIESKFCGAVVKWLLRLPFFHSGTEILTEICGRRRFQTIINIPPLQ